MGGGVESKQRVRKLALGSLGLALGIYLFGIWPGSLVTIDMKDRWPDWFGIMITADLWAGIFFSLRPLIPDGQK